MLPYIATASLLALLAILERPFRSIRPVWWIAGLFLVVFVGLRHKVGMDWNNYLGMHSAVAQGDLLDAFQVTEPAYALLIYIGDLIGYQIYLSNFLAALISIVGLMLFARRSPNPFLAVAYAFPYLVVVMFMSGTRQGAALGVIFAMYAYWDRLGVVGKTLLVLLATLFHTSAIIFLSFVALGMNISRTVKGFAVLVFSGVSIYYLVSAGRSEVYQSYFAEAADAASGAVFHVALVAIPAACYFIFPRQRDVLFPTRFLRHLAFAALLTVPLVTVSTITASRLSTYWFPMAIWVWASLPMVFGRRDHTLVKTLLALVTIFLTWAWLSLSNSSTAWVPYNNAIFEESYRLDFI